MSKNYNKSQIAQPVEKSIDVGAIYNKYKRYWWLFLLSVAACLALAIIYLRVKAPTYRIVSTVLVAQDDDASSAGAAVLKTLSIGGGGSKVDDEVVVLGSQEICIQAIKVLKLNRIYKEKIGFLKKKDHYRTSPIEIDVSDSVLDTLMTSLKFNISVDKNGKADIVVKKGMFSTVKTIRNAALPATVNTQFGTFEVKTTPYYKPLKPLEINAMVFGNVPRAEGIMEELGVKVLSKKSNAILLDFVDNNIERGKDLLNTMISLYNNRGNNEKNEQARNTAKFIEERLKSIYATLNASEAQIEDYKKRNNVADVGLQTKASVERQEKSDAKIVALETQYRIVGMINEFVNDPKNRYSYIPFEADSIAASGSIKAFNQLAAKRAELMQSAKGENEALKALDQQLDDMRRTIVKGVNNTLSALRLQIDNASQQNAKSENEIGKIPTQERDMRALYRDQGIQNSLYTFLLQKREENELVLAATTPKGKVVDHAYAKSKPVAPNTMSTLFLALLAGLALPAIFFYFKSLINNKFSTQDELAELTTSPVIGEICHSRHKEALVVKPKSTSSVTELFRLLRNNVQFLMHERDDKVVLVTSSMSGEGKSFISLNLSAAFALLGKKVALVGMDIRSPKLASMLGINELPGVTGYLSNSASSIEDIIQHVPDVPGLDVIVAGAIPPNPSELLLGDKTNQLVDELRRNYEIVIIDSAPVAMVSDSFSVAPMCDVTLYVARASHTKKSLIKFLNNIISRGQLKRVALVLNDTNPKISQGYGYGYGQDKE